MIPKVLFYWYYVIITATTGGQVYATGDWRLPLSEADYGDRIETKWVIAGTEGRSSCYAWVKADEGFRFAGFADENGQMVTPDTPLAEIRLWATTESAQEEDGIVSGNDLYPTAALHYTAVFLPDDQDGIDELKSDELKEINDDACFDLQGRRIITPRNGQIIIRNRRKIMH
ncbi:MAG: hypothetical protein IKQ37_08305 [Bacteroidaceae bacterium]|nr:hypothetical protein [Bacteroidaceae bacterium]